MSNETDTPFTNTELIIISLVLSQQRDQYEGKTRRQIDNISTKARKAVDHE